MGPGTSASPALAIIAAMITPAILILGSASLVASALMRMARVVDRARLLASITHDETWATIGITPAELRAWLDRHARRARYAAQSIFLFYGAIVVFIAACLSIAVSRLLSESLPWLPVILAIFGTLLMLMGGAWMVIESKASGEQIHDEIRLAISKLEHLNS